MATLAVNAAKALAVMARHQTAVKALAVAFGGLVISIKALRTFTSTVIMFQQFTKIVNGSSLAARAFGVALRFMTGPIGIAITVIAALGAAFVALYKHNAKFRAFVNGIGKQLKNMGKSFVNAGRGILKSADNLHKKLSKGWSNYWRQRQREQQQAQKREDRYWDSVRKSATKGWNNFVRSAQSGAKRVNSAYQSMNSWTSKQLNNMARNHPRTFGNMYRLIQDCTRVWHDVVSGHWSDLGRDTGRLASDASRTNRSIFKSMYDDINDKTDGGLGRVVSSWQSHMSSIGDAIKSAAKHAAQAMADLANLVLKPFKILIDDIQGGINWILDKVGASKLGGSWSAAIPTFATGTAGNPDGLKKSTIGMVNDGQGSHWRELYSYKGHVGAFPNKRNFITYLPKGMSILNGEDSHKLMNIMGIPRFANGLGGGFTAFFKSILKDSDALLEHVPDILKHPIDFVKSVFDDMITGHINSNIKFAKSLIEGVPPYIATKMAEWIKKQFQELANPGGSGVARWRPYIERAAKMEGINLTPTMMRKMLTQINTESKGDPRAIGGTDGLSDGHATGLLQFKPGTFRSWIWHGHGNIMNGFDQILAAFNALQHGGEGGWGSFGIPGRGWANGGLISTHGMYEVGEGNKPEMIIPLSASKRSRAYQLLSEVMAQFKYEDNNGSETHSSGGLYDKQDFVNVQRLIDELNNGIKTLISLQQTQIAVTKAQGKFDPHQQYIQQAQALSMKLQQY